MPDPAVIDAKLAEVERLAAAPPTEGRAALADLFEPAILTPTTTEGKAYRLNVDFKIETAALDEEGGRSGLLVPQKVYGKTGCGGRI
jgi:hypothetical protein